MRSKTSLFRHISILDGLLASFAAMVVLGGCSLFDSTKKANSGAAPAPTQQAVSTSPTPPAAGATPASGPAIATSDGDKPGTRIEILELKRTSGDTVTVKFAMVNDSDKALSFGYDFTDPEHSVKDFGGIGGIHLIDAAGKKKYFVVRDTENTCVCSNKVPDISPKSRASLWAKFPAPPADVQKINIVIPHFIPADDVPINSRDSILLRNDPMRRKKILTPTLLFLALVSAAFQPSASAQDETTQGTGKILDLVFRVEDLGGKVEDLKVKETGQEIRIELAADVLFDFDKAEILPKAQDALKQAAAIIKEKAKGTVRVEGHTDGKGADEYNQKLSERRAAAVRSWFADKEGITNVEFSTTGFGAKRPKAPNKKPDGSDDPDGRQQNRRVEIIVKK